MTRELTYALNDELTDALTDELADELTGDRIDSLIDALTDAPIGEQNRIAFRAPRPTAGRHGGNSLSGFMSAASEIVRPIY